MPGGTFGCHSWQGGGCWHLVDRDQDAAVHPVTPMTDPPTKNYLVPNVDSAEIEKVCSRGLNIISSSPVF